MCVPYLETDIPSLARANEKIPHVRIDSAHGFCDSNMTDVSPHKLGIKPTEPILNIEQ
jgi:elongation factor P hydroxylase